MEIQLNAEVVLELRSKQDWIRKCPSHLPQKRYYKEDFLFLDIKGNRLEIGEDFAAAEELNLYPVKVYRIFRTVDSLPKNRKS